MGLKKVKDRDVEDIVKFSGKYYRQSKLYLYYSNSGDAYKYYVDTYGPDIEVLVAQGHTYQYKGNYIVGCDILKFREEHKEVFQHYYGVEPFLIKYVNSEERPMMYIPLIAPKDGTVNPKCYAMIREFVKMYGKDYLILTDCFLDEEVALFAEQTNGQIINLASNHYLRWA